MNKDDFASALTIIDELSSTEAKEVSYNELSVIKRK
jgi:hypothetical protein